jgi:hypothetical protein
MRPMAVTPSMFGIKLNAIGYFTAAVAMIVPLALAVRFRWFIRLGLIGYAATTILARARGAAGAGA